MMRTHDEELLERYQRAVVSARARHVDSQIARENGQIDYFAEVEAHFHDGQAVAYGWLLGQSPVSPQRMLAAVVNRDTMREEYQAAEAEMAAGEERHRAREDDLEHRYDIDEPAHYASGVAEAIAWALSRADAPAL
jgi:hypothetical protein